MKIEPKEISIREVAENYVDDGDGGVYGLDGELVKATLSARVYLSADSEKRGNRYGNARISVKFNVLVSEPEGF